MNYHSRNGYPWAAMGLGPSLQALAPPNAEQAQLFPQIFVVAAVTSQVMFLLRKFRVWKVREQLGLLP